jgi:hypothetical protein
MHMQSMPGSFGVAGPCAMLLRTSNLVNILINIEGVCNTPSPHNESQNRCSRPTESQHLVLLVWSV